MADLKKVRLKNENGEEILISKDQVEGLPDDRIYLDLTSELTAESTLLDLANCLISKGYLTETNKYYYFYLNAYVRFGTTYIFDNIRIAKMNGGENYSFESIIDWRKFASAYDKTMTIHNFYSSHEEFLTENDLPASETLSTYVDLAQHNITGESTFIELCNLLTGINPSGIFNFKIFRHGSYYYFHNVSVANRGVKFLLGTMTYDEYLYQLSYTGEDTTTLNDVIGSIMSGGNKYISSKEFSALVQRVGTNETTLQDKANSGEVYKKTEIDTKLGDINSILDKLNGEVV